MWTHWARGPRVCTKSSIPITWGRSGLLCHWLFCLSNFSSIFMQLSRTIIPTWTTICQVRPLWELTVKLSCPSYGQGVRLNRLLQPIKPPVVERTSAAHFLESFVLSWALNIRGHLQTQGHLQKWLLSHMLSSQEWTNLFLTAEPSPGVLETTQIPVEHLIVPHLRVRSTSYWRSTCHRHVLGCTSKGPFHFRRN